VAATLTSASELTYASFPIEKVESTPDGNLLVFGKATDGSVDSDEQIVHPDWASKAIQEWMDTGPNVRVQHQAQRDPAGVGISFESDGDATWVKSLIVEPVAKSLVQSGALRAYSVGIAKPTIVRDAVARGGRITDGQIVEISLVDRPANKNCGIQLVKAAKDGTPEWVGKVFGSDDTLAKMAGTDVTLTLPHDVQMSFSPLDMAKIVSRKTFQKSVGSFGPIPPVPVDAPVAGKDPRRFPYPVGGALSAAAKMDTIKAAEADVYKRDIDTATRRRLADEGHALPNLSYPIETTSDLANAATLARSGHGDVAAARRLIARRAKELGVKNPLKADGKVKKSEKKRARKAAAVAQQALPDSTKKDKILCMSCGAKQHDTHKFCAECGKSVAGAPPVEKNHDFQCLDCGNDLDKGERFCPQCGKGNPGYNMLADQKIPANKMLFKGTDNPDGSRVAAEPADSTETVVKARKPKGKKGKMPFGDKQAPPFGKDKDGAGGGNPAEKAKKPAKPKVVKKKKGKGGFGHTASPGDGVAGRGGMDTVPEHREPDGLDVSAFERDAGLPVDGRPAPHKVPAMKGKGKTSAAITVGTSAPGRRGKAKKAKVPATSVTPDSGMPDGHMHPVPGHRPAAGNQEFDRNAGRSADPAAAASMRLKSLGIAPDQGYAHDLACPAFGWDDVDKAYPTGFSDLSANAWQQKALEAAASAPLAQAQAASQLGQAVYAIKTAALNDLMDVKNDLNKAFKDANPGPGSFPTPGDVHPQSYRRPNITSGRAAYSHQYQGPNSAKVPTEHAMASQFTGDGVQSGRADASPANKGAPYPKVTGTPVNLNYSNVHKDNIVQAFRAMHDHFDRTFPGVCPMNGDVTRPSAHSLVPAQKAAGAAVTKKVSPDGMSKKRRKKMAKKLTKKVMAGKMPLDTARVRMGKKPKTMPAPLKPQKAAQPGAIKATLVKGEAVLTRKAVAAVVLRAQKKSDKKIAALTKAVNVLADQPDPATQAFKGMAWNPMRTKSAGPAGVQTTAEIAEHTQLMIMRELENTARNSTNSMEREAAWNQVLKMKGITSA
jgi:hypothetical protein